MKFEKLTDNKLKIIFTADDMSLNNVSTKAILSNNSISQKLLQSLLSKAEQKVGFKADDCDLIVEAVSINGGIIFTITKITSDHDLYNNLNLIYKFESFENFLDFCTYLNNMNFNDYTGFSLFLYNKKYYLSVGANNKRFSDLKLLLGEFGDNANSFPIMNGILHEYGKTVMDEISFSNAVKLFI